MDNDLRIFVPFTKKDEDKRIVEGYASTEALDSQGEVVEKDAIIRALPAYLGEYDEESGRFRYGNLREMHQLSAVGKTMKAKIDDKGLYVEGKIVDDNAWKKCKEGVYAGFSIGGKVLKQFKNRIKDLKLSEISLVDRPANPEAVFAMVKIDGKKVTNMQKETTGEVEIKEPKYEEIMEAGFILDLARDIRSIMNMFEYEGKPTKELEKVLELLKKLATKLLNKEDKKKFEAILYGVNEEEMLKYTLEKAKLSAAQRKKIPAGKFAYIDSKGGEHLPIQDKAHVQNAMARFNQTQFESPEKKKSAAHKILAAARKFGIEIDPNSAVARAAKKAAVSEYINTSWSPGYFETMRKVMG